MDTNAALYHYSRNQLTRSPLFSGLASSLIDEMLRHFRLETCDKGSRMTASQTRERFYVILDGRMEINRGNAESGRQIMLFLLGPGDGFDIITLLDGEPHDAESVALDEVRLLSAPIERVRDWIAEHPEFNRRFLPYLGSQFRGLETLASDLALHDTATRLARLILRHTDPLELDADGKCHPVRLIADLSHETLANMVGSVRQVVNRHLQDMRRNGVVHGDKGHWIVKDLEALKHHAGVILQRIEHHGG